MNGSCLSTSSLYVIFSYKIAENTLTIYCDNLNNSVTILKNRISILTFLEPQSYHYRISTTTVFWFQTHNNPLPRYIHNFNYHSKQYNFELDTQKQMYRKPINKFRKQTKKIETNLFTHMLYTHHN